MLKGKRGKLKQCNMYRGFTYKEYCKITAPYNKLYDVMDITWDNGKKSSGVQFPYWFKQTRADYKSFTAHTEGPLGGRHDWKKVVIQWMNLRKFKKEGLPCDGFDCDCVENDCEHSRLRYFRWNEGAKVNYVVYNYGGNYRGRKRAAKQTSKQAKRAKLMDQLTNCKSEIVRTNHPLAKGQPISVDELWKKLLEEDRREREQKG